MGRLRSFRECKIRATCLLFLAHVQHQIVINHLEAVLIDDGFLQTLDLPGEVVEKIYWRNAQALLTPA